LVDAGIYTGTAPSSPSTRRIDPEHANVDLRNCRRVAADPRASAAADRP
jgi:hypothetical protein